MFINNIIEPDFLYLFSIQSFLTFDFSIIGILTSVAEWYHCDLFSVFLWLLVMLNALVSTLVQYIHSQFLINRGIIDSSTWNTRQCTQNLCNLQVSTCCIYGTQHSTLSSGRDHNLLGKQKRNHTQCTWCEVLHD